jgi:signal transduction histidine kinase
MPLTPHPKVLVIDDELGPRESLRILLKNEFQVFLAENVDAGLRLLQEQHPDVILLDIRMPGMNGIDGLKEIRKLDQEVSVLMLTGFGTLETAQEAIRRGANDYLKKPFDTREMQDTVREHVRRTRFQRRHRQTTEELRKINQMLIEELARKNHMAQMGQKSAEFMHDLRNPLTAVLGYVELLGDELRQSKDKLGSQWEETSEFLQNIEKNLEHCRELSQMWLQLGRKDQQVLQPLPLNDLLHEVVESVHLQCLERGIQLELVIPPSACCHVIGEHIQLVRAFTNLASNALDAVAEKAGVVKIQCRCEGPWAEIRLSDNGPGISPENLPRIFEPYFSTKGKAGTGLGLFITQQVIVERGGTITAESNPGEGATFIVRLPLAKASCKK